MSKRDDSQLAKIFVMNWKMNGDAALLAAYATVLAAPPASQRWVVCPPFTLLEQARAVLPAHVATAAQHCHWQAQGAATGAVSATLLAATGVRYCLVGHSEQRRMGQDTAMMVKAAGLLRAQGIVPIFCVGEEAADKSPSAREALLRREWAALDIQPGDWLAYEPLWAIGQGVTPDAADLQDVLGLLRSLDVHKYLGACLYGGSVAPDNAGLFLQTAGFDGVLVGGASLAIDKVSAFMDGHL